MSKSKTTNNQGVVITGGNVTVDQITVGTNARSEKIINSLKEDGVDINKLNATLEEFIDILKENNKLFSPEVIESVELIKAEANKPKPNKIVMVSVLDAVADTAKAFVPVLQVIKLIKSAILEFF